MPDSPQQPPQAAEPPEDAPGGGTAPQDPTYPTQPYLAPPYAGPQYPTAPYGMPQQGGQPPQYYAGPPSNQPPGGYNPYQPPYGPPQQPPFPGQPGGLPPLPPENRLALHGIILAVLVWPVGLGLSLAALNKSRKLNGAGRRQATAGIWVAVCVGLASIITTAVLNSGSTGDSGTAGAGGVFSAPPALSTSPPPTDLTPNADENDPGCLAVWAEISGMVDQMKQAAGDGPTIEKLSLSDSTTLEDDSTTAQDPVLSNILSDASSQLDNLDFDLPLIGGTASSSPKVEADLSGFYADMTALKTLCAS